MELIRGELVMVLRLMVKLGLKAVVVEYHKAWVMG